MLSILTFGAIVHSLAILLDARGLVHSRIHSTKFLGLRLDEFLIVIAIMSVASAVFAWRRWREAREAEQIAAQSERRYRAVVEHSADAILIVDDAWNVQFANHAACQMLGYNHDEMLRLNIEATYAPEDRALIAQRRQLSSAGQTLQFERLVRRRDGSFFPAEVTLCRVDEGRIQGILRDITERKQAEAALHELQRQQRALLDNIPDIAWLKDRDSRYLAVNEALAKAYGHAPEDVVGKTDLDFLPADLAERYRADDRRVMESRQRKRIEEPFEDSTGHRTWIETIKTPIINDRGEVLGTAGIARDMTERRNAEEALRASEERYRGLFEMMREGFALCEIICDASGRPCDFRYLEVNSAFEQIIGLPRGAVVGKTVREIFPATESYWIETYGEVALTGKSIHYENYFAPLDRHFAMAVFCPKPRQFAVIFADVSKRKLAEQALREEEQRLRRHNEFLTTLARHDALLGENLDQAFGAFTVTAAAALNIERASIWLYDEARTKITCADLFEATPSRHSRGIELLARDFPAYFRALAAEKTIIANDAHTDPQTSEFSASYLTPLDISSMLDVPLRLQGQVVGVLCCEHVGAPRTWSMADQNFASGLGALVSLALEAHKQRQTEAALRDSKTNLENALTELKAAEQHVVQQERLRALGTMASGIAHDFNNALAAILGFTELILHRPDTLDDKDKTLRYVQMMNTAALDAGNIVNRLREFYRHREDKDAFGPVDLGAVAEQAALLTKPRWMNEAQAKGITLDVNIETQDVPPISGNAGELREVLTNLIFNALDAMPDGGTVTIRTRRDDTHALLEVADTGAGMTEEVRRRCLEPFFSTKGERGTGLGLAMVYGIIQRHGGDIDILSAPGQGTTFTIRIPLLAKRAGRANAAHAERLERALRVLVVDDEPQVRDILSEYLRTDGHSVETAGNGSEGLDKLLQGPFDLVLVDRAMPGVSGDQVATVIKATTPDLPVIMLTGFGTMMKAAGEIPVSVDSVISKPVTLDQLRAAMAGVVAG